MARVTRGRLLAVGLLAVGFSLAERPCWSAVKVEVLAIGNNSAPRAAEEANEDPSLPTLRYADDDAAAFFELVGEIADTGHLLTVMDGETQAIYPALATAARPPTVDELHGAVSDIAHRIEDNRRRGDRSVVFIFFSGHGSVVEGIGPSLALLDGRITHKAFYEEILDRLPADYVHVFVDACHAEGVVRPRDAQARSVPVTPAEAGAFLARSTLARFPNVGAVVAASSDAEAHEWDQLGHGVFTHELISALRGAADVNHDGRIEYSEIYAFLAAANRGVRDPRARLDVVARPPQIDRHVAVLDLSRFPLHKMARLQGVPATAGLVQLEDGAGRRLASLREEPGFIADLVIPAGTTYVRAGDREARFEGHPGEVISFDSLGFRPPRARARGAVEDAVRRGLFASQFGPGYYSGFIDQAPEFASVSVAATSGVRVEASPPSAPPERADAGRTTRRAAILGAGVSNAIARPLQLSEALRIGLRPMGRAGLALSIDLERAADPGISESRATALAGWLWALRLGPARAYAGAAAGAGMIQQTATGSPSRWSAQLAAGPTAGVAVAAIDGGRLGLWLEAQALGIAYRREGHSDVALAPSAFVGASVGF